MTAITNQHFRNVSARLFYESFTNDAKNRYVFIGRANPWDDDTRPDTPVDSVANRLEAWRDMIAAKRIGQSDVSYVIPRFNWESGTKYIAFDPADADLYAHPTASEVISGQSQGYTAGSFYVVTDEYKVYICLDNADVVSTVKPTDTSMAVVTYSDGYKWKFLYHISNADTEKFVTNNWIPVKTLTEDDGSLQWHVQQAAVDGAIEVVRINTVGTGFVRVHQGSVLTATSGSVTFANDGAVSDVDDYYTGCAVFIVSGTGVGQSALITDYVGATKTATIACDQTGSVWDTNPANGDSYQIRPLVTISGDGTGAIAKASVTNGTISDVDVVDAGAGYHFATATISGGGGSSASCTAIVGWGDGIGANPVYQLGGSRVMVSSTLSYNEGAGDFPVDNDYRKIGIVTAITTHGTSDLATASTLRVCPAMVLDTIVGTFDPDETVTGSITSAQAQVIENIVSGAGSSMKYHQNNSTGWETFQVGETIEGSTSGATAVVSALLPSEVNPYDGEVIYIEHRRPIARTSEQTEHLRLIVRF